MREDPRYAFRHSILTNETHWSIADGALIERDGAAETRIPLTDVTSLRLDFDPSRVETNRYRCVLRCANGREIPLLSVSYTGFADFEDRGAAYSAFVAALIAALARHNPACRFLTGKAKATYIPEILLLAVSAVMLLFILLLMGIPLIGIALLKLGLVAALFPAARDYIARNRPRTFAPDAPPADLLP